MADKQDEKALREAEEAAGVATDKQNEKLEHTRGGLTTRDDTHDLGVPMLPGSPKEPQGPEDALGPGDKRGDYTKRMGSEEYHPHTSVLIEDDEAGTPIMAEGPDGEDVAVDLHPVSRMVPQRQRTEEIGEVEGKKGGVDSAEE